MGKEMLVEDNELKSMLHYFAQKKHKDRLFFDETEFYVKVSQLCGKKLDSIKVKAHNAYINGNYEEASSLFMEFFEMHKKMEAEISEFDFSDLYINLKLLITCFGYYIYEYNASYREYGMCLAKNGSYFDAIDVIMSNIPIPETVDDMVHGRCAEYAMYIYDLCQCVLMWRKDNISNESIYENGADLLIHKFSKALSDNYKIVARGYYQNLCEHGYNDDYEKNEIVYNILCANKSYLKYHLAHYLRTGDAKSKAFIENVLK